MISALKDRFRRFVSGVDITEEDGIYRMEADGFEWYLPYPNIEKFHTSKNFTEKYDRYIDRLTPGDVFLKVGAAVGEDVVPASVAVGPQGAVYAIEAEPGNYRCLEENVRLRGGDNVVTENVAVSDTAGDQVEFSVHGSSYTTHRVSDAPLIRDEEEYSSITIPTTTVDTFCEEHDVDSVTMLSVTVNRYEAAVIRGANRTLENTDYVVVPENDREYGGDAVTLLREAGFERVAEGVVGSLFENTDL